MAILAPSAETSAHWYYADGRACHTQPRNDGEGTRPTTLIDARKQQLFPSVSAILRVLDKPGLDLWRIKQAILAADRAPRAQGETDAYFINRALQASEQIKRDAGDFGTEVHGELENYIRSLLGHDQYAPGPHARRIEPVIAWMQEIKLQPVASESRLVNVQHGFGGTTDLPCKLPGDLVAVVDFKTTRSKPGVKIEPFEDQAMQIAAYGATYWKEDFKRCWGMNVFISSTEPGRIEVAIYSPEMLHAEWVIFQNLCAVWRHLNAYDPRPNKRKFYEFKHRVICAGFEPEPVASSEPVVAPPVESAAPVPTEAAPANPTPAEAAQTPTFERECHGIKFLLPADCAELETRGIASAYGWWKHETENTVALNRVGLLNDPEFGNAGWVLLGKAYAADLENEERVANGGTTPMTVGKDELPIKGKKARPSRSKAAKAARAAAKQANVGEQT